MAENIVKLRRKAKGLGIAASVVRTASRADLEEAIRAASKSSNGSSTAKKKKKAVAAVAEAPRKRGRPKGSTNKPKAISGKANKRTPAESSAPQSKAKRSAPASSNGKAGRLLVGNLSFTNYDPEDWNPREGSRTALIFKALKRAKGDVEKTFDALEGDVNDLIVRTKRNGEKRTKDERLEMLRYHIHQVRWRFAIQTGQHEKGTNRREYGTGDYAAASKPARGRPKAKATEAAPKKRGRPPKAKAEAEPTKRRGRPPGSKNKNKKKATR